MHIITLFPALFFLQIPCISATAGADKKVGQVDKKIPDSMQSMLINLLSWERRFFDQENTNDGNTRTLRRQLHYLRR